MAGRLLTILLLALPLMTVAASAEDENRINLRLFGDNVVEGWTGCRLAFWQNNKSPETDAYAYVFFAPIPDGEALPAWVKIDDRIIEVSAAAAAAGPDGLLAPVQLYRSPDSDLTVVVEILEQGRSDRGIEIGDARLTYLMKEKFPFAARVKGLNGCLAEPAYGTKQDGSGFSALTLGQGVDFEGLSAVPSGVLRAVASDAPECDPAQTPGLGSSYAISDAMVLWQIPCNLYAARGSSVFVVAFAQTPDHASVLWLPGTELSRAGPEAFMPNIEPNRGLLVTESPDSEPTCPVLERFELREAEGESVEFVFIGSGKTAGC